MILINNYHYENGSPRKLSLEIEYSMNRSLPLGICVFNDKEYYELMNLLKEKGFLWADGTSQPDESWGTSISSHTVPLLIILRDYRITRSSYGLDSYFKMDEIESIFNFSDFH